MRWYSTKVGFAAACAMALAAGPALAQGAHDYDSPNDWYTTYGIGTSQNGHYNDGNQQQSNNNGNRFGSNEYGNQNGWQNGQNGNHFGSNESGKQNRWANNENDQRFGSNS